MKSAYQKVIVVGGSQLAIECIQIMREYYDGVVLFFDVDQEYTVLKQAMCEQYEVEHSLCGKECIMDYLEQVQENTLVLSIMNNYLFTKKVVSNHRIKIVNLHHAILPGHRGRNVAAWAIFHEENDAGITWHEVDAGVDTGEVIIVKKTPILDNMTSLKLMKQQNLLAIEAFGEIIKDLLSDTVKTYVPAAGEDYLHRMQDIPNGGYLDSSWSGHKISAFLKAMDFGVLRTLGIPKIEIEGQSYQWKKYKISKCDRNEQRVGIENDTIIILKNGYRIELCSIMK